MRGLIVLVGLSALLTGCIADRELPGRGPFWTTAETARNLGVLTPAIAKECAEHIAKEFPKIKLVGAFFISAKAAYVRAERPVTFLPTDAADNTVAVVAPSLSQGLWRETESITGCLYRLRDNRLVFEKADLFGPRPIGGTLE
jgi:hypothetical protein